MTTTSIGNPTENGGSSNSSQIYTYFGALSLFLYLATPAGALVDISTTFMLKDYVHATPDQVSTYRLLTAIPLYAAFVFGLIRDKWNPIGLRDRGYFLIFAPVTALIFVWLAFGTVGMSMLTVGILSAILAFRLVAAAYQGLMALIGQEKLMSGRLATVWQVVASIPSIASAALGGVAAEHLKPKETFLMLAALCIVLGLLGLWKPRAVFSHAYDKPQARTTHFWADVTRLLKHTAIYPAILMCLLWNFAPGSATPLQFYLTNTLHASDASYGYFNAIFTASFLPTFFLYGFLCKRWNLEKLLWVGTLIAVPQMIPLAFVHSTTSAMIAAVPIGLMGGMATLAYFDLAMRSCPAGLQGTLMMLIEGALALSARGGDKLGTWIFKFGNANGQQNGFLYCVIAITVVYACILPLILLVPKHVMSTPDGQANPELDREILEGMEETTSV